MGFLVVIRCSIVKPMRVQPILFWKLGSEVLSELLCVLTLAAEWLVCVYVCVSVCMCVRPASCCCSVSTHRPSRQCWSARHGGRTQRTSPSSPLLTTGQQATLPAPCSPRSRPGARPRQRVAQLPVSFPGVPSGLRREGSSGKVGLRESRGALRADPGARPAPHRLLVFSPQREGDMHVLFVSVPSRRRGGFVGGYRRGWGCWVRSYNSRRWRRFCRRYDGYRGGSRSSGNGGRTAFPPGYQAARDRLCGKRFTSR